MPHQHDTTSAVRAMPPLVADPEVRRCACDALDGGLDPLAVAALIEVCVEDLHDVLGYVPREAAA